MTRICVIGIIGESVFLTVDRHQRVGETAHAGSIHRELGGKGYNQAVAAARFGAEVTFIGCVNNQDADSVAQHAMSEGITPLIKTSDIPSPYAAIITDKTGDNIVTVYGGCRLSTSDIYSCADAIRAQDILLINNEAPEEVNIAAAKIAKESGAIVVLNPAPAREISEELISLVDLFTPNEHEYPALGDRRNVIVTEGARGTYSVWNGERYRAIGIDRVVDTTGAGDTFSGALAVLVAERLGREASGGDITAYNLKEECMLAGAAATLEVTRPYVMGAIPTRDEAERFLRDSAK